MSATTAELRDDTCLVLERYLEAPPARVWQAWTTTEALKRWFGPEGIEVLVADVDLRPGGRYRVVMKSETDEHRVGGTYEEIVPNERLVFTWAWESTPERESRVTVTLAPEGDGTRLVLTHERFADRDATERHAAGWSSSFNRLAAEVA